MKISRVIYRNLMGESVSGPLYTVSIDKTLAHSGLVALHFTILITLNGFSLSAYPGSSQVVSFTVNPRNLTVGGQQAAGGGYRSTQRVNRFAPPQQPIRLGGPGLAVGSWQWANRIIAAVGIERIERRHVYYDYHSDIKIKH